MCVCAHVQVCMCTFVCMRTFMCVCVYVCVCVFEKSDKKHLCGIVCIHVFLLKQNHDRQRYDMRQQRV